MSYIVGRIRRSLLLPLLVMAAGAALALPSWASATPTPTSGDITGTVSVGGTGTSGLTVLAFPAGANPDANLYSYDANAETGAGGSYDLSGLPGGAYTVIALPTASDGYLPTYSNGATTYAAASTVAVSVNTTSSGNNIALVEGATVSGTITGTSNSGVGGVEVVLLNASGSSLSEPVSDGSGGLSSHNLEQTTATTGIVGSYTITDIPASTYWVKIDGSLDTADNYANVWYGGSASEAGSTPIPLTPGASQPVNQALPKAAEITGTVDSGGLPFTGGGTVGVYDGADEEVNSVSLSTANGAYKVPGLPAGSYSLKFTPTNPVGSGATYYSEGWYDGSGLAVSQAAGTAVTVAAGATVAASTVSLSTGGSISGTVRTNGNPVGGVTVTLYDGGDDAIARTGTTADGAYSFGGDGLFFLPGSYKVGFSTPSGGGTLGFQYYANATSLAAATAVSISGAGANTAGINATLSTGGAITGTVTDASSGSPLPNAEVELEDAQGNVLSSMLTGEDGTYTVAGIPTGTYYLEFNQPFGNYSKAYQLQYYGGKQVLAGSTTVSVTAGETLSGINAALMSASTAGQVTTTTTTTTTTVPVDVDVAPTLTATRPLISGAAKVGSVLTAKVSGWTPGTIFGYQWSAAGKAIMGATNAKFTLSPADYRKAITVTVTGRLSGYTWVTETSVSTTPVTTGTLKTGVPKIIGTPRTGKTLTATPGGSTKGTRFTYQWYANRRAIHRATRRTLKLTRAEAGKTITVKVTGKLTGYTSATKTSRATKPITD